MLYEFDQHISEKLPCHPEDEPTDEQLMVLIQNQDDTALAMLYRRHTRLLRTIVARVVNNEHDVDDAVQEIFLEVWRQAGRYSEEKGKALGWIVTLARRRAIDRLRKKLAYGRAEERLRVETENGFESAMTKHPVNDQVAASETSRVFHRIINALPVAQRDALRLSFYSGLSQREIAVRTGIPLGTIKTRIELGIRKFRQSILALGGRAEWGFEEAY